MTNSAPHAGSLHRRFTAQVLRDGVMEYPSLQMNGCHLSLLNSAPPPLLHARARTSVHAEFIGLPCRARAAESILVERHLYQGTPPHRQSILLPDPALRTSSTKTAFLRRIARKKPCPPSFYCFSKQLLRCGASKYGADDILGIWWEAAATTMPCTVRVVEDLGGGGS